MTFTPDYMNIVDAACNIAAKRLPLYEHSISTDHMERVLNRQFAELINGDFSDKREFFRLYCEFFRKMGYDIVSYEVAIRDVFPGGGALDSQITPAISTREDLKRYPWGELAGIYKKKADQLFFALAEVMPEGMKLIGGPGYGIFECVQDLTGYENLAIMGYEEPDLFADMFLAMRKLYMSIWTDFLSTHNDMVCVARMGDDLGFKSNTLLSEDNIKQHIIPGYADIVKLAHSYKKPFLLHSCGAIFNVMDDLISVAKINAKHSNEDQIAPFSEWVDRYGDKIGNFGGADTDALCRMDKKQLEQYIIEILSKVENKGGIAFSTGNSVPDYVPTENYIHMTEVVRRYRGDQVI